MHLTEAQIRSIISELILEGYKDDQRFLQEKYPKYSETLAVLPPKWITWLINQYKDEVKRTEIHTFEDAIVTLVKFAQRDGDLSRKYRASAKFKEDVDSYFSPNERGWRDWSDPNEALKVTIDQMETIMGLALRKKQSVEVNQVEDIEVDRVGKVGSWNLWMPTTMERSCKIAQYDPITRIPKTTWCTARTSGSNLFYHYVGRTDADIVLFYVIKDNAAGVTDWLSIGYYNGKPLLKGKNGDLSVDRDNFGLTPEKLQAILGSDYDTIMAMLDKKAKEISGVHPAKEKVKSAAKDPVLFKQLTTGHSKEEDDEMKRMIANMDDVSPEVLSLLADENNSELTYQVIMKPQTPTEVLDRIVDNSLKNKNISNALYVGSHPNASPESLRKLAETLPEGELRPVASNPRTPVDVLVKLSNSMNPSVLGGLVINDSLPTEGIENIVMNGPRSVQGIPAFPLVDNPNITPDQLVRLMGMTNQVRDYALKSPKLPMDMLLPMLQGDTTWTSRQAYLNPNVPTDYLVRYMADPEIHDVFKAELLQNPAMPESIVRQWFEDEGKGPERIFYLIKNAKLPEDIMLRLAKTGSVDTRHDLVANRGITDTVLRVLAKDRSASVKRFAARVLKKRQESAVNEAVMRIISRLIR